MAMQLPYNENAEKVVLGAALMSERSAGYVMTSVVEDHTPKRCAFHFSM